MRSPAEPSRLTAAVAHARRRLVVWCPDWPVRAVASSGIPVGESTPVALVAAGVVHACSTAARAQGVRRGLRVREAQSRCPDLLTLAHDPELDARVFGPLVDLVADVVPHVHVPRPGTATVGVDGAVRVHGSEAAVGAILAERVVGHGVDDVRVGVADTVFAAEQAARRAPAQDTLVAPSETTAQFLAPLPIDVLDEPELAHLLRRLGLWTLGDLALLPEPAVRERFGALGVACHRRARGIEDRAFTPRAEPVPHEVSTFFDTPLRRAEQVVASCEEAAERFVADPAEMTDLPKAGREEIVSGLMPPLLTSVKTLVADGGNTLKQVHRLHDGALVESVIMRYPGRVTMCISSQAGCGMNCPFCATGQEGLTRNMSTAEIVDQVVAANRMLKDAGPEELLLAALSDALDKLAGARDRSSAAQRARSAVAMTASSTTSLTSETATGSWPPSPKPTQKRQNSRMGRLGERAHRPVAML